MEILGIGMSELVFVILIALIVLGPKDMQKAGRTVGKFLRSIVTSDGWKIFQQTSRELRTLPNKLIRDANNELNQIGNQIGDSNPTLRPAQEAASEKLTTTNPPQRSQPYAAYPAPRKPPEQVLPAAAEHTSPDGWREGKENEGGEPKDA